MPCILVHVYCGSIQRVQTTEYHFIIEQKILINMSYLSIVISDINHESARGYQTNHSKTILIIWWDCPSLWLADLSDTLSVATCGNSYYQMSDNGRCWAKGLLKEPHWVVSTVCLGAASWWLNITEAQRKLRNSFKRDKRREARRTSWK